MAEVAVFGVPQPQWGETVKAVVVVREPVADCTPSYRPIWNRYWPTTNVRACTQKWICCRATRTVR
ncbi:hypothetical protein ULG90_10075 [Halopseudomonas pachastrellae]|nr:hypothetical protein ULG90_10075 [Halopseudomonas pachastrellae]